MVGAGGRNGFLAAHWDWLALGLAVLFLAFAGYVGIGAYSADDDSGASAPTIRRPSGKDTGVKPVDISEYERAVVVVRKPPALAPVPEKGGNFLTAPARVRCEFCNAVMVVDAEECPACKKTPSVKDLPVVPVDSDEDGLPDAWEKQYGLNERDASDANADTDGDGFTNAEEYAAQTDPSKKSSHPDYLDSMQLVLPLKEKLIPFSFTGVYQTPSGLKYQFKDPSRSKEYDRGVYSVLEGGEIGKTGFTVKSYEKKSVKRKMGGGMTKEIDASEATVVRTEDGKVVKLVVGRAKTPIDVQAKLVFTRGETKEFVVVPGSAIEVFGEKFTVKEIQPVGKGAKVAIADKVGKIRTLEALEQ